MELQNSLSFSLRKADSYLACCYKILEGMDSQTEDIIIVAHVETLGILLPIIHNANRSYVVDYLPRLGVEQITSAIVAPVAASTRYMSSILTLLSEILSVMTLLRLPMNEVKLYSTPRCSLFLFHGSGSVFLFALLFELR